MTVLRAIALTIAFFGAICTAQARFDCGRTQADHFDLPYDPYARALAWAGLPHTDAHPGAVVVQTRRGHDSAGGPGGHVSRIVRNTGHCEAVVTDEKGTYERDICKNLVAYVQPDGVRHERRRYSRTFHAKTRRIHYAAAEFSMPDIAVGVH